MGVNVWQLNKYMITQKLPDPGLRSQYIIRGLDYSYTLNTHKVVGTSPI